MLQSRSGATASTFLALMLGAFGAPAAAAAETHAADGENVTVTGELIDTWCYFSGVMGGPDAVVGSAHHTCAMWCAAGGIPVGLMTEDGTVYTVVKWEGDANIGDGGAMLKIASHQVTANGTAFTRDGVNYIIVDKVVSDDGIVNQNHDDQFVVPPFAIPEPE